MCRDLPVATARTSILPPVQKQLLESLAATGKPLVVVLLNGSALAVTLGAATCRGNSRGMVSGRGGRRRDCRNAFRKEQSVGPAAGDLLRIDRSAAAV